MTKREKEYVNYAYAKYLNSKFSDITEAYGKPSLAKQRICREIWYECHQMHGKNLKVVNNNVQFFTAGYTFEMDGQTFFKYITKSKDYIIPIEG